MVVAVVLILFAVFFYLLLRGAARGRDRALEDMAQAEYLHRLVMEKHQKKQ